jgi:phosphopantothenate---cysteine ligase (CTP)
MKNVIITSGGTSEPIDNVRKITNSSSGRLGSLIANEILKRKDLNTLFYICSKNSVLPNVVENNNHLKILYITTVEELKNTVEELLKDYNIDLFIHSMAVSDYKVDYATTSYDLSKILENKNNEEIIKLLDSKIGIDKSNKISSSFQDLIIRLVPTPKVIGTIKKLSKKTTLVGFKLLSGVSEEELLSIAKKLLIKNDCDYVLANDIKNISENKHLSTIIDKTNKVVHLETKNDIAQFMGSIYDKL